MVGGRWEREYEGLGGENEEGGRGRGGARRSGGNLGQVLSSSSGSRARGVWPTIWRRELKAAQSSLPGSNAQRISYERLIQVVANVGIAQAFEPTEFLTTIHDLVM